jgi:hypothetical protein
MSKKGKKNKENGQLKLDLNASNQADPHTYGKHDNSHHTKSRTIYIDLRSNIYRSILNRKME